MTAASTEARASGIGPLLRIGCLALLVASGGAASAVRAAEGEGSGETGSAATNLTQTMQADSGVAIQTLCTNCNNADLSVSGLGNEHVAVVCDGIPVPAGLAQIYLLSVMPSSVIDKVAVTKGAGESQLAGSSVGGAIEIDRREPKDGLVLNVSGDTGQYGWAGTRFDLSGKSGRFGGSLVGSWATQDTVDVETGAAARETRESLGGGEQAVAGDYPSLPSFDRYTVEGRGEIELTRNQTLDFGALRYDESQENGPAGVGIRIVQQPPFFNDETVFAGYNLENVELERRQYDAQYALGFDGGGGLDVSAAWSDRSQVIDETDVLRTDPFDPEPDFSFFETYVIDETQRQADASVSRPIGQRTVLRAGVSSRWREDEIIDHAFNGFQGYAADFRLTEDMVERGVWVQGNLTLSSDVELSAGLRWVDYDYEDNEPRESWRPPEEGGSCTGTAEDPDACRLPGGDRLLPRATLNWKPTDELRLRVSAGAGYRIPSPVFEEVCCGRRYRNNRGIKIEESTSYGLELTYQPRPGLRLGGALFVTDFDQLLIKMATTTNTFYRHTYQNVNVPEARRSSMTLDFSAEATSWMTIKGSVSLLDADNRTPGDRIPTVIDPGFSPQDRLFVSDEIPYSVGERAAVSFDFTPGLGFQVNLSAQYTGETLVQRFDPALSAPDDLRFEPADDFWITNLGLTRQFAKGYSLFVGVDNISDYVQNDLGDPHYDANWGPLRGRYVYGGIGYRLNSRR